MLLPVGLKLQMSGGFWIAYRGMGAISMMHPGKGLTLPNAMRESMLLVADMSVNVSHAATAILPTVTGGASGLA